MPADNQLNSNIACILKLGAYLAAGIIWAGFMALIILGWGNTIPNTTIAPSLQLLFKQPWPLILINLGVLILMVTPVAWVLLAAVTFAKRKEFRLALISATVLAVLLFAMVFGLK